MPPTPPSKRRKLADTLTAQPTKRFQFTQQSGPRKGQGYNVVTGKSGLSIRKYASGDTAIASTDAGVNVAAQKRDVANRFEGSVPKRYTAQARQQIAQAPRGGFDSSGSASQQQARKLASTLRKPRRKPTPFGGRIR